MLTLLRCKIAMQRKFLVTLIVCSCLQYTGTAWAEKFSIITTSEKWTGLAGAVVCDGEQVDLEDSLWKVNYAAIPDGKELIPHRRTNPGRGLQNKGTTEVLKLELSGPVVLRIRGKKIEFKTGQAKTIPSDFDGRYLGYPLNGDAVQLKLCEKSGKETEWNVIDGEREVSRSPGEFQFQIRQKLRFQLEAANRPGWFFTIDDEGRMCVSDQDPHDDTINLDINVGYDDQSDGK